jgi:hypothetical protein
MCFFNLVVIHDNVSFNIFFVFSDFSFSNVPPWFAATFSELDKIAAADCRLEHRRFGGRGFIRRALLNLVQKLAAQLDAQLAAQLGSRLAVLCEANPT